MLRLIFVTIGLTLTIRFIKIFKKVHMEQNAINFYSLYEEQQNNI